MASPRIAERRESEGGHAYLLGGPARLEVLEGEVEVFGRSFGPGEEVIAKKHRALPVEVVRRSKFRLVRGGEGAMVRREDIGCAMWSDLAREVVERPRDIVVAGEPDSGKTGMTTFLANELLEAGERPGVVDADPGQGDLGVPGMIGASALSGQVTTLEDARVGRTHFIGSTSPYGLEEELERGIENLKEFLVADGCTQVLVCMHGWIQGGDAKRHLMRSVEAVGKPMVLVMGGKERDADSFRSHLGNSEESSLDLRFSEVPGVHERDTSQRRDIRERKLRSYFAERDFVELEKETDEVELRGTGMFSRSRWDLNRDSRRTLLEALDLPMSCDVYVERVGDRLLALVSVPGARMLLRQVSRRVGRWGVEAYTYGEEMGLTVGVSNPAGGWCMGRVLRVDSDSKRWSLSLPETCSGFGEAVIGRMVLDEDGRPQRPLNGDFF